MRDNRGASAVEFAIVASVLFLILFGIVEFGIVFNRYQGLQAGAREGARLGSLSQTTLDDIYNRVKDSVSIIDPDDLSNGCSAGEPSSLGSGCIQITPNDTQPCNLRSGQTVVVETRYRQEITIPVWPNSPDIVITGRGEFRCE